MVSLIQNNNLTVRMKKSSMKNAPNGSTPAINVLERIRKKQYEKHFKY